MNKILLIFMVLAFCGLNLSYGQTSFLTDDGVAVFYPAHFDSARTLPSFAIIQDLKPEGKVPAHWDIVPEFFQENGKAGVRIAYKRHVDLYGTGEVTGPLRRNGTQITLWNTDNYMYAKYDGKQLYQSHPWVLGVRKNGTAFGILADNTWKQTFSLKNPITILSDGPAFRVIVIEKKTPQEVLETLGKLTGTMQLPPLWALGYQQSRYSYYPDSRVKEVASEFRAKKIPCDVIWMDIHYMQNFKIFTFDSIRFPHPKAVNDFLHKKDFHSVWMIDPGVKKEKGYFVYDQGTAGNYWVLDSLRQEFNGKVWPGDCAFPDFTMPEARKWWGGLYKNFLAEGIDGVWNDMNEPSVFNGPGGTMPESNIHRGGGGLPEDIHLRYHDVYGMLMVRASREGILKANPDKRPFVLSRSNYLGGQRYAATWTGDNTSTWEHFKMATPMVLNLGLSGQPFSGPDLGGYKGTPDTTLFASWIALGAFYPFCRDHTDVESANQEPWAFGQKVEDVARTALDRRYRLLPYLYTVFREASVTGLPVMRPVFFADLKDESLRSEQESFLVGKDLLIIPRWAKDTKLPSGNWKTLKLEKSDDGYQPTVKLRSGAIIPVTKLIQSTVEYKTDSVTLLINPDKKGFATGTLYDDSGNGFEYQKGDFDLYKFVSSKYNRKQLKVEISKVDGTREVKRVYRVGYVSDGAISYSGWSDSNVLYVPIVKKKKR